MSKRLNNTQFRYQPLFFWVVAIYFFLNLWGAYYDGPTIDEPIYIGAGHALWTEGVWHLNPFHPLLVKALAGLGVSFLNLNPIPPLSLVDVLYNGQLYPAALLSANTGRLHEIVFAARFMIIMLNSVLAFFFIRGLERFLGGRYALFGGILLLFSPTFLAHSRYVTLDVSCALLCALAVQYILRYAIQGSFARIAAAMAVLLLALQSKFSAWMIVPVVWCACLINFHSSLSWMFRCTVRLFGILVLVVVVIALTYQYGLRKAPDSYLIAYQKRLISEGRGAFHAVVDSATREPALRGAGWYLTGLFSAINLKDKVKPQQILLGSRIYVGGDPYYFPILFFTKETLPFLLLSCIALFVLAKKCTRFPCVFRRSRASFKRVYILSALLFVAAFWGIGISSNLNIGLRHMLPTYPFIAVLIVETAGRAERRYPYIGRWLLPLLILSHVSLSLFQLPHVLPYFNGLSRLYGEGPVAIDSNYDWGQDTYRLSLAAKRMNLPVVYYSTLTYIDPSWYGGKTQYYPMSMAQMETLPAGSYVAISKGYIRLHRVQKQMQGEKGPELWIDSQCLKEDVGATLSLFRIGGC